MSVQWSALHAALGVDSRPLTYDLVRQAIASDVVETSELDWKRALPGSSKEEAEEFAKDVAAMANSGGGLLVYGVHEERGTGKAQGISSVDVTEAAQRRLKSLAATRISPMVVGVAAIALVADEGARDGVLVLSIPPSADMPHTIGSQSRLGFPYRDGPDTRWMSERELERAYAERFGRRTAEDQRLADLTGELAHRLDLDSRSWVVGVASPRASQGGPLTRLSRADATKRLKMALARTNEILPSGHTHRYALLSDLDNAALNPRVGLRRWIAETRSLEGPDGRCDDVYVEVHHDGSVGFAAATEGWYRPVLKDKHQVPVTFVESFAADFTALLTSAGGRGAAAAPMAVRVDLLRGDEKPYAGLDYRKIAQFYTGELEQPVWSRTVRSFTPVLAEVDPMAENEASREVAALLAADVVNQFGFPNLQLLTAVSAETSS